MFKPYLQYSVSMPNIIIAIFTLYIYCQKMPPTRKEKGKGRMPISRPAMTIENQHTIESGPSVVIEHQRATPPLPAHTTPLSADVFQQL